MTDADDLDAAMNDPSEWGAPQRFPKSEKRRRMAVVTVRLNDDELAALQAAAKQRRQTTSAFLREAAMRLARGFYEDDEPVEDVVKAFDEGEKRVTVKPIPCGGHVVTAPQTYGGNGLPTISTFAHCEDGMWWAEGQVGDARMYAGESREKLFEFVREGVEFYLGTDKFNLVMWDELPPGVRVSAA